MALSYSTPHHLPCSKEVTSGLLLLEYGTIETDGLHTVICIWGLCVQPKASLTSLIHTSNVGSNHTAMVGSTLLNNTTVAMQRQSHQTWIC